MHFREIIILDLKGLHYQWKKYYFLRKKERERETLYLHILEFTLGKESHVVKPTEDPDGITSPYISSRLLTNAVASTKERDR